MALDITGFELTNHGDGHWRHVHHGRRLATSGWLFRDGAEKNAKGYRGDRAALGLMAKRYAELYPDAPAPAFTPAPAVAPLSVCVVQYLCAEGLPTTRCELYHSEARALRAVEALHAANVNARLVRLTEVAQLVAGLPVYQPLTDY